MMEELQEYIDLIIDTELREGVEEYLKIYAVKLAKFPASTYWHHTEEGGLIRHILEVCEFSLMMVERLLITVDTDHVIVAALLHDIGKVREYYQDEYGKWVKIKYKVRQPNHSIFPIIDFPEKIGMALPWDVCVAILGHMGGWSETSVYPDTELGVIIHTADMLSSRLRR